MAGNFSYLKPNVAARDQEFLIEFKPAGSSTEIGPNGIGIEETAIHDTCAGRPYPESGFRQWVKWVLDPSTGATSWEIHLVWPFYGIDEVVRGGGTPTLSSKVKLTAAQVTTNCSAWQHAFTQLDWYVGGSATPSFTFVPGGPQSGINWRRIYNAGFWSVGCIFAAGEFGGNTGVEFTPQLPPCPEVSRTIDAAPGTLRIGFRWYDPGPPAWTNEPMTVEVLGDKSPFHNAGCPVCSCVGTLPSISGTDTWNLVISGLAAYYQGSGAGPFTGTCECADGTESGVLTFSKGMAHGYLRGASGWINSESAGIKRHRKEVKAGCFCHWPLTNELYTDASWFTNEPITKVAYGLTTIEWRGTKWCWFGLEACPEPPGPRECAGHTDELCVYDGLKQILWIDPGCGVGSFHLCTAPNGVMFAAQIEASEIRIWRFDLENDNKTLDAITVAATSAQVAFDSRGVLHLVYDDAGTVKWSTCSSWGDSWTTPVAIGSGSYPAIATDPAGNAYVLLRAATHWRLWRLEPDAAAFVDLGVNVSAAAAGVAALEVSTRRENELVAIIESGGNAYRFSSTNRGFEWSAGVLIGSGTKPAFAIDPLSGSEHVALYDGVTWQVWRQNDDRINWTNVGPILTTTAVQSGLEWHPGSDHNLVFITADGTDRVRYLSTNSGQDWESH